MRPWAKYLLAWGLATMLCACAGAGLLALCMLLSNNGGGSGDMDSLAMLVVLSSIALMYGSPFVGLAIAAGVLDFLKEKNRRAERRRKQGRCVKCGYSLRGNESGVCSECGTSVEEE